MTVNISLHRRKDQVCTHPSFGSLIDFKLMYSSYSNKPAIVRHSPFAELVTPGRHTVEFGVVAVEVQFRLEKEDVFPNERCISYPELSLYRPSHAFPLLEQRAIEQPPCVESIPRTPSPPTPRIKLSIQLECCCASRTTMGWPS